MTRRDWRASIRISPEEKDERHSIDIARSCADRRACRPRSGAREGARLSEPPGHLRGAVRARWRHRHPGAAGRSETERALRQIVRDREPSRRRHRDRRRPGREERPRRLHHHDGDQRHHGDEPDLYKKLPYDPGSDLVLVGADLQRAVRARRQPGAAGPLGRRPGQAREGEAAELRLGRRRRLPSPHGRVVQDHVRDPDDPRALQGHAAGPERRRRRSYPIDVQRSAPAFR